MPKNHLIIGDLTCTEEIACARLTGCTELKLSDYLRLIVFELFMAFLFGLSFAFFTAIVLWGFNA